MAPTSHHPQRGGRPVVAEPTTTKAKLSDTNWDLPPSAASKRRSAKSKRAAATPAGSRTKQQQQQEDEQGEEEETADRMDMGTDIEGAAEIVAVGTDSSWYLKADQYWKNVPATVNGMLGGFEVLSEPDVRGSLEFIREFVDGPSARLQRNLVLDCGAGIGRVTREFLLKVFQQTDTVEQNPLFVEQAKTYVPPGSVQNFFCTGLQHFTPEPQRYDAIWVQWVLGHLNEEDFVAFFQRCKMGVKPGGLIFVKENVSRSGFVIDEDDSSMTRSDPLIKRLFDRAGLRVIKQTQQSDFPTDIFPVFMYALDWDRN